MNISGRLAKLEAAQPGPQKIVVLWPGEPEPEIGDNATIIRVIYTEDFSK
jgi:hypothetical protein